MTLNQIIGNKKTESKVDTELWKKLNEKYSDNITKTVAETTQSTQANETIDNILTHDTNGKPIIALTEQQLQKTKIINVVSQKEYDTLMQIYESANLRYNLKILPTDSNIWNQYKTETCIEISLINTPIEPIIIFKQAKQYNLFVSTILNIDTFYHIQNIKPEQIKELNIWYNTYKPDRASKG
jgi:hypothetical protein